VGIIQEEQWGPFRKITKEKRRLNAVGKVMKHGMDCRIKTGDQPGWPVSTS
jgi:hypothetical protein